MQHEFVFHGEGGSFVAIEAHADLPREKFFEGKPAGKIAQREIVVQLDEKIRIGLGEKILAGNFAGIDGAERNGGLRSPQRSSIPWRGECPAGGQANPDRHSCAWRDRHRPAWQAPDPFTTSAPIPVGSETIQKAKKLRRQSQRERKFAHAGDRSAFALFLPEPGLPLKIAQTALPDVLYAVLFRKDQQAGPIRGAEQIGEPLSDRAKEKRTRAARTIRW